MSLPHPLKSAVYLQFKLLIKVLNEITYMSALEKNHLINAAMP